ncbi:MAG: hypothetical protein SPL22_01350, partial [Treponema sp.]|uniref:outer membrane beta-barrel protein n=1 Tax=Treponema sp. TaxID=166 RepID=UPI002A9179BB
ATALSAEITFGSWGRALWVTAANGGYTEPNKDGTTSFKSETVTDVHQSWGGAAPRTALAVSGNSDNVGFKLDIHGNATGLGQGDNAYIWVKPIDQVKLSVGRMDDTTLRGDCVNGLWDWDRIGAVDGDEGWTFGGYFQSKGVNVQATPVEGLLIGAAIPLSLSENNAGKDDSEYWDANKGVGKDSGKTLSGVYAHGTAYLGAYTIEGVGTIKAALKTLPKKEVEKDGNKEEKSQTEIAAAFDLTAVENLFVSVGAKINTLKEANTRNINAYARYNVNEQLTVHARVGTKLNAQDKKDEKDPKKDGQFGFLFGAGIDYNLDGGIGLFADVRYANGIYKNDSSADKKDCLTIGAGVTKGFSNGKIGVAFEGATNNGGRYQTNEKSDGFSWEIPVKFEYWF